MSDIVERLRRDAARFAAMAAAGDQPWVADAAWAADAFHAAADEIERLRAAALDVLATATAAVSLLSRGGKRAVPSDTMFLQMLSDYEASVTRARALLTEGGR